jgi:hypothetical protein
MNQISTLANLAICEDSIGKTYVTNRTKPGGSGNDNYEYLPSGTEAEYSISSEHVHS